MTKSQIKVGGIYTALVNSGLVWLRVLLILPEGVYQTLNCHTGVFVIAKSPRRFRSEITFPATDHWSWDLIRNREQLDGDLLKIAFLRTVHKVDYATAKRAVRGA